MHKGKCSIVRKDLGYWQLGGGLVRVIQVVFYGDSVTDSYVVGTYSTRMRARNKADKLDNEYGAYRYSVKAVEV